MAISETFVRYYLVLSTEYELLGHYSLSNVLRPEILFYVLCNYVPINPNYMLYPP